MRRSHVRWMVLTSLLAACSGSDEFEETPDTGGGGSGDVDVPTDADPDSGDSDVEQPEPDAADAAEVNDAADVPDPPDAVEPDTDEPDVEQPDAVDAADTTDGSSEPEDVDVVEDVAADVVEDVATDVVEDVAADAGDVAADVEPDVEGDVVEPTFGTVAGTVMLALTNNTVPLQGVTVRSGDATTTSDSEGRFVLTGVATGDRVLVEAISESPDSAFSSSARYIAVDESSVGKVAFELLQGCQGNVSVGTEDGVILPNTCGAGDALVGITLPGGGVVDSEGNVVNNVLVQMIPLPLQFAGAGSGDALLAFPGDMSAVDFGGTPVFLESRGAVEIRLTNTDNGLPANLADGETATVLFTASESSLEEVDVGVPMWVFDTDSGHWVREPGLVSTVEIEPFSGRLVHRVELPHFSWWNADVPSTAACITGRLVDSGGGAIGGRYVQTRGVDYLGASGAQTDADGRFTVRARRSSQAVFSATFEVGSRSVTTRRDVSTLPDESTCTDLGDVVLDTESLIACARGRAVTAEGRTGVERAEVVATSGRQVYRTTTASDGSFCLPVPAEPYDVAVATAFLIGRVNGLVGVGGTGYCSETGDSCTDLGEVSMLELGCVTGSVVSSDGPIGGALVTGRGRRGSSYATSAVDGTFCLPMEQGESVDLIGQTRGLFSVPGRFGQLLDVDIPNSLGDCLVPRTCAIANVLIDDRNCLSGRVQDDLGTALPGARVTVTPIEGGAATTVFADAAGDFCAPVAPGIEARIQVQSFSPGVRYVGQASVIVPDTVGSCALSTCSDVGVVVASGTSFNTCVTGRLLDRAPLPFNDTATLSFDGASVAIVPDRTGRFCVDIPVTASITITDDVERECFVPREASFDVTAVTGSSCADRTGCQDIGDLDFEDFCFFS